MKTQNADKRKSSDADLMLAVERARRRNRVNGRLERELWSAYVLDGAGPTPPAANDPPPDVA